MSRVLGGLAVALSAAALLADAGLARAAPDAPAEAAAPSTPTAILTPPAVGPSQRTVAIVELGGGEDSARLANALAAAVARARGLAGVGDPAVAAARVGARPEEDAAAIAAAGRALAGAQEHLARFEANAAIAQAQLGASQLLTVAPTPTTTLLLTELAFTEGLAQLAAPGGGDAREALGLAHALQPERVLDPAVFAPEVIAAYRDAASPRGTGAISVEGDGTVWIDGRARGRAPLLVAADAGAHVVVVYGPERLPRGARIRVPADGVAAVPIAAAPAPLAVQVARARRTLIAAPDQAARAAAVGKIAALSGATDALVLARNGSGALTVQRWRDRAPGFGPIEPVDGRDPAELLAPLLPPPDPVDPTPVPPPPPPATPWWRRRSVQAAIAGAVIAVALTSVALSAGDDTMRPLDPEQGFPER
ncbi:MAG: hypothetical protein R2939_18580 [Kofleriaceae bacterium]